MNKIKILFFTVMLFAISSSANAASKYEINLRNCLNQNTSERDQVIIAKWVFAAISEHSSIKSKIDLSKRTKVEFKSAFANYIEFVLGDKCIKETKDAIKYDQKGFENAFESLGEIAMETLMKDPNVIKSLEDWLEYTSEDFVKKMN